MGTDLNALKTTVKRSENSQKLPTFDHKIRFKNMIYKNKTFNMYRTIESFEEKDFQILIGLHLKLYHGRTKEKILKHFEIWP